MEYWIDGYNLILRRGGPRPDELMEAARERLLRGATALAVPMRIYFDASGGGGPAVAARSQGAVRAIYVGDRSADDQMVSDLRAHGNPRDVTIVTDDRELRQRARQLKANTLGVARFGERLDRAVSPASHPAPGRPEKGEARPAGGNLSKKQVDEWLDYFGIDEDWKPE